MCAAAETGRQKLEIEAAALWNSLSASCIRPLLACNRAHRDQITLYCVAIAVLELLKFLVNRLLYHTHAPFPSLSHPPFYPTFSGIISPPLLLARPASLYHTLEEFKVIA